MANQPVRTPIEPSVIQRVTQGIRYIFTGKPGAQWFGPNVPQETQAPVDVKGRAFDYPTGVNLGLRPRENDGSGISFADLRALSDNFDLLRLVIETRKDQMQKLEWTIQPKKPFGQQVRPKADARCERLESFFQYPDRVNPWGTWLRMLLEDVIVLDAPSIYVRKTVGGDVWGFEVVDGATIKILLAPDGRRPLPPMPAYQQVLKGVPAVSYTMEELIYMPRNPRPHRAYGMGFVEQIVFTVNIALRRAVHKLQFYTEGNIPEALIGVPEDWTPEQIAQFQLYWDTLLEGDTAQRRHAKFVPGRLQVQFTRDPQLQDQYDEWLARVVCYCFSLPPFPFVKETNRATAQTAYEAAIQEGLEPFMRYVKGIMDHMIQRHFNHPDLEWVWSNERAMKPDERAAIDNQLIRLGIKSIDDARIERGLDPLGIGPALFGIGPGGMIFLSDLADPEKRERILGLSPPQQPLMLPPGVTPEQAIEMGLSEEATDLFKRALEEIDPDDYP